MGVDNHKKTMNDTNIFKLILVDDVQILPSNLQHSQTDDIYTIIKPTIQDILK